MSIDFHGFPVPDSKSRKLFVCSAPYTTFEDMTDRQRIRFKPFGLWYACGSEWVDWLRSEMPDWYEAAKYLYEIKVVQKEVLKLESVKDVLKFNEQHGVYRTYSQEIDWPTVARQHAGIEICPYQQRLRMSEDVGWYYPWDVASGCIWNADGVKSVELLYARK